MRQEYMRLSESTVAVVGLGLLGGSLALALRGKCAAIVGVARRAEVAQNALVRGVVEAVRGDMREAVREADIVVLATPVRHIIAAIPEVAAHMRSGALLMDLGSTKVQVVRAMESVAEGVSAVGGHPMCGKEVGGLEHADPSIFEGATFALTPTARTTEEGMELACRLVEATAARPLVLDAERHDRAAATVSHLPYLLAATLVHTETQAGERDPAVRQLAASGFRDTSRLAASEVEMMLDVLLTNREAVEAALNAFDRKLAEARGMLGEPEALKRWMAEAQRERREMFT
jgi:prephenate dehydrogenase